MSAFHVMSRRAAAVCVFLGILLALVGFVRLAVERGTDEEEQCYSVIGVGVGLTVLSVAAWVALRRRR